MPIPKDPTPDPEAGSPEQVTTELPESDPKRARVIAFHPILFGAFPLLALYATNIGEVPIQHVFRPLLISLAGSVAAWALIAFVTRNGRKAALAASALILVFISYGHLANLSSESMRPAVAPFC